MEAGLVAFGVVFVSEIGDKSQLLAMSLAARYGASTVLLALAFMAAVLLAAAVAAGSLVSAAVNGGVLTVVAGSAFLLFAAWTWRQADAPEDEDARLSQKGLLGAVFALGVAELGDKTMVAAAGLATTGSPVATWAGATVGLVAADVLAVLAGGWVSRRLPQRVVRKGAAVLFALSGALLIADGLAG